MKLFSKEQLNKARNDKNQEIRMTTDKLVSSMKKAIKLKESFDFDTEKAKAIHDFDVFCQTLNDKKSQALKELNNFTSARDLAKDELYSVIARKDKFEDEILDLKEEISRLQPQVEFIKLKLKEYA